jgi:hypothetical protein
MNCHPERSRGICGYFSVPVAVLGCPILDEVKGGIPLPLSPFLSMDAGGVGAQSSHALHREALR